MNTSQNPSAQNPTTATPQDALHIDALNDLIAVFKGVQAAVVKLRPLLLRHDLEHLTRRLYALIDKAGDIQYDLDPAQWSAEDDANNPEPVINRPPPDQSQDDLIRELNTAFDSLCAAMEFNRELGLTFEHLGYVVFDAEQMLIRVEGLQIIRNPKRYADNAGLMYCDTISFKPMSARRIDFYNALRQATPRGENDFQTNPHRQYLLELERRYRAVKGSFEMLTVFASPNAKSAAAMVEDAELLLEAAKRLSASFTGGDTDAVNADTEATTQAALDALYTELGRLEASKAEVDALTAYALMHLLLNGGMK